MVAVSNRNTPPSTEVVPIPSQASAAFEVLASKPNTMTALENSASLEEPMAVVATLVAGQLLVLSVLAR